MRGTWIRIGKSCATDDLERGSVKAIITRSLVNIASGWGLHQCIGPLAIFVDRRKTERSQIGDRPMSSA